MTSLSETDTLSNRAPGASGTNSSADLGKRPAHTGRAERRLTARLNGESGGDRRVRDGSIAVRMPLATRFMPAPFRL
jgi:hypothetical protein